MWFDPYPSVTDVWEFAGEEWVVVMTQRLPIGDAVGNLSVDGTYDDGWATLRHADGYERIVAIPELIADGTVLSGPHITDPFLRKCPDGKPDLLGVYAPKGYPFDPDELVRHANMYGHPEEWIKKAQELYARVEKLEAENEKLRASI